MKNYIEKLLEYGNDGGGNEFNVNYDVKNQLFTKILIAKKYHFYEKLVSLFENDCKKLKERLGENWYKNAFARYMLYRKYNIKEIRKKCDNFPSCECDSSEYSQKFVFKTYEQIDKIKKNPWLTIEKFGERVFFADTLTAAWTFLRSLIEYCIMIDRDEIFEEEVYEDLQGHKIFNFKVPSDDLERLSKITEKEIGTKNYEVVLCEYILENIVSVIEIFKKYIGDIEEVYSFIQLSHSGSGCNFCIVPREMLNRSRDPYLNRKIAPGIELPNAGRVWDLVDVPIFLIHSWYQLNFNTEINYNKYDEQKDFPLKILTKYKKEKDLKNIKIWLMSYSNYDNFIGKYKLSSYVYKKTEKINLLLEELSNIDKNYSIKYGFPIELYKGHLYKYDFRNNINEALPYGIYKANSVEENFPLIGYVNGVEDFKQFLKIFKCTSEKRREEII